MTTDRPIPARLSSKEYRAWMGLDPTTGKSDFYPSNKIRLPKPSNMSKAEADYGRILCSEFRTAVIAFEPITLRLPSGARYTPDWIVWEGARIALAVEVKGAYRLGSASRSALAFKEAIAAFPHIRFRHAHKSKEGWQTAESKPPHSIPVDYQPPPALMPATEPQTRHAARLNPHP